MLINWFKYLRMLNRCGNRSVDSSLVRQNVRGTNTPLPAEDAWSEIIFLFCFSYTKVVAKGMKKAEMILKVKTFPGIVS